MVLRKPQLARVARAFAALGRPLRVGTMCSGTEAPVLALQMIARALGRYHGTPLRVEKVFSAEIEGFKQAYIQRNFPEGILFRDCTELGDDRAHTASGALVDVPGGLDLLVAGTSCVDNSSLNKTKKTKKGAIHGTKGQGESARTFAGMLAYAKRHTPTIVVIENTEQTPWDHMVCHFDEAGYEAGYSKVDTKKYYIPHTRSRGYLVAFHRGTIRKRGGRAAIPVLPRAWREYVRAFERPCGPTSVEHFLYPADHPHAVRGRAQIASGRGAGRRGGGKKSSGWGRCEVRHRRARHGELLGDGRPMTSWREGALARYHDVAWNAHLVKLSNRDQDLTDIQALRAAAEHRDASHKMYVWNTSQNVDMQSSDKPGITPCLTPRGRPHLTDQGRVIMGIECLRLQGIPVEDLNLPRESDHNLRDFAGNAMTTTVVGACMASALLLVADYLRPMPAVTAAAARAAAAVTPGIGRR